MMNEDTMQQGAMQEGAMQEGMVTVPAGNEPAAWGVAVRDPIPACSEDMGCVPGEPFLAEGEHSPCQGGITPGMPHSQSSGEDPEEDGGEPGDGALAGSFAEPRLPVSSLTGRNDSFGFGSGGDGESDEPLPPGTDLGGVTIERLLGEGGMGRVYVGWQAVPRRRVAIKVIRSAGLACEPGTSGEAAGRHPVERLERFAREAEFLARLRHPHIAQIHTFGLHADGASAGGLPRPYFVMELVEDARPMTRHAALRGLSIRSRLALFRKVCGAVAHAHAQGVVHRDLKPANILVGRDGEPKVIDFGVARADESAGGWQTGDWQTSGWQADGAQVRVPLAAGLTAGLTATGDVVGTLHYMSPEQLEGDAIQTTRHGAAGRRVDCRSDVYSLGLVLHQLLTGTLPYDLQRASLAEAVRLVCGDAAPDTTRVEQAAAAECGRDDARALATLVAKCLEKRPADRYQSAGELAAELDRWLTGEPILARPPTALESLRRFGRRHRAAAAALGGVAAAGLVAIVGISMFWLQAERQRREADRQAAQSRTQLYFSNVLLAAEARDRDNITEARRLLESARDLVADAGTSRPIELACLAASFDESLDVLEPVAVFPVLSSGAAGDPRPPTITAVAWAPSGDVVAVGDGNGGLRLWRHHSKPGMPDRQTLEGHGEGVWAIAWAPDNTWLASASATGEVAVWDVASGQRIATLRGPDTLGPQNTSHASPVYAVDVSPDGATLVTAGRDGTVRVWGTRAWDEQGVLHGHEGTVFAVAVSPDGLSVASSGADRTVRLWSLASGREEAVLRGHDGRVYDVAFSPGNTWLASASDDGTVRMWDLRTWDLRSASEASEGREDAFAAPVREAMRLEHPRRVNGVSFIEGTSCLATASGDGILRVWNLASGREQARLHGHTGPLWSIGSTSGGNLFGGGAVATGSADGTVRIWGIPGSSGAVLPIVAEEERVMAVECAPDGRRLAVALADGRVRLHDGTSFRPVGDLISGASRVNAVAFSPDGRELIAGCDQGTVCAWRLPLSHALSRDASCSDASCSDASGSDASCSDAPVHDALSRKPVVTEPCSTARPHSRRVFGVAYAPDGRRLATAGEDGTARLWRRPPSTGVNPVAGADLGESEAILKHPRRVFCVAFSPDGRHLATACEDRKVRLWDVADGREVRQCGTESDRHAGAVNWLAFTAAGDRLATASSDATVRLWCVADGRLLHVLQGPSRQIWKVAFSPDGQRVAAVSADGTAQLWDATTGRAALMLRGHDDQAWAVAFTPTTDALVTGGWDRTLRVWGLSAAQLARRQQVTSLLETP